MNNSKIGEGYTTNVYLYENRVFKYFKKNPDKKISLTLERIERLRNIYTRRILLPNNPIFGDNFELLGYEMEYVEDKGVDSYFNLNKKDLKKENELLKKDIETCSNNKIILSDLFYQNAVYNDGIYIIDPGDFSFRDNFNKNYVYRINIDYINEFLIFEVIKHYHLLHHSKTGNIKDSNSFCQRVYHEYLNSKKESALEFFYSVKENSLASYIERKSSK